MALTRSNGFNTASRLFLKGCVPSLDVEQARSQWWVLFLFPWMPCTLPGKLEVSGNLVKSNLVLVDQLGGELLPLRRQFGSLVKETC